MHHHNWWLIALIVSTIARNTLTYMPEPKSAPGFISSPWYPVIYHFIQSVIALNPTSSADMLKQAAQLKNQFLQNHLDQTQLDQKKENQP